MYVLVNVRMSNVVFPCLCRSIPHYRHKAKNSSRMPIRRSSSLTVARTGWHPVIQSWTQHVFIAQATKLARAPHARLQQARCGKTTFIPYSCQQLEAVAVRYDASAVSRTEVFKYRENSTTKLFIQLATAAKTMKQRSVDESHILKPSLLHIIWYALLYQQKPRERHIERCKTYREWESKQSTILEHRQEMLIRYRCGNSQG